MGTARARYVLDDVCVCVCVGVCVGGWVYVCMYVCIITTNIVFLFLFRSNWSPPEYSKKALQDKKYNTLYYMNDPKGNF